MSNIIQITTFSDSRLDIYARLTEAQLMNRFDPSNAMFIAESPKVIHRALDAGYIPVSLLMEEKDIEGSALEPYFVDHTVGVYPTAASGFPWSAASMQVKGDPIADLCEDLAAEQKARVTYDNILRLCDDPDVRDPIKFLREREIVHYQRFAERVQSRWNGCGVADKNRII